MNGKVKFFNESKGFGFIVADDGNEYFVHLTGLNDGVRLRENDAVTFDVEQGDRGPKAVNVSIGSGESAPAEEPADEPVEESADESAEESADEPADSESFGDEPDDEEKKAA